MDNFSCRVLLVEDSEDDFLLVRDLLGDIAAIEFEVQWADTFQGARTALAREQHDLCLLDYRLGEGTGIDLVREFAHLNAPFILLTGNEDYQVDLEAARAGAADYLVKDRIDAPLLERSIRYALERRKAVAALAQAQRFAQNTLDALSESIAVLDEHGSIVALNALWRIAVGSNDFLGAASAVGANYLQACAQSDVPEGRDAAAGIRRVIAGEEETFCVEYCYHNPREPCLDGESSGESRWFGMSATRFSGEGPIHVVVAHEDITERKQAESALRESEARSNAVIQHALDCIITIDSQERVVEFNPAAEATFGYTRDEAMGQSLSDLIVPPEFHQAHHEGIARYLATGEGPILNRRVEVPARRKDGTQITVELAATAIAHADPPMFTAYLRDITARKQHEDALRESEERFASIAANVPGMVYQFVIQSDGSAAWPFVSQGCRELFEIEPEVLRANPAISMDRVHPDDRAEFYSTIEDSARTLAPWSWEGRERVPSGKIKWMQAVARPARTPEGGTLWNGVVMDVTARKEAEEERDRFFTMSLDILGIFDVDGCFKRVNPAFIEILGFTQAELAAQPFLDWVHPEDQAATQKAAASLAQGAVVVGFENRYRSKDGSYRWLEWRAVAAVEEGVIYAAARDITQRKEAEETLLRMRDELEVRVQERTHALKLSNQTLQQEIVVRECAEREVRVQARQHEAVAEMGRQALLNIDIDTLLHNVTSLVAATLEVEACAFWQRQLASTCSGTQVIQSDMLQLRAGAGVTDEMRQFGDRTVGDGTQVGYCALLNEPVISEDLSRENRFRPSTSLVARGITSTITVPVHDDVMYGVLAVCSGRKRRWNQNEVFFLQTVANVLASAMARKQAEAEILQLNTNLRGANDELRANEARLLQGNQISTALMRLRVRTQAELQEALRQITESAGAMLGIERSGVWLFNASGTKLRCVDLYERQAQRHSGGIELEEDSKYFPEIKAQRVVVAEDAQADPITRECGASYLQENNIASLLDVPLVVGGKNIGVLRSEHVGAPRTWQAEDRTFAGAIASVCSLVLESYERARAEAALHEAKEEAESATERANEANAAKSEFLSRMSHELRTPLNAILGFGQILEMRTADAKQKGSIEQILKAGRHLLSLINEVLDIARIEAGQLSLSLEPIPVDSVVREALDLVRPLAAARQIYLIDEVEGECGARHLLADQQRLKQVLLNLLSNAVKYNRHGGYVFVSCHVVAPFDDTPKSSSKNSKDEGRLRFLVRDTGAGLSGSDIAKLFVPFERLEAARSQIEGTGIGLTLCKRLVEAMGGAIGVESEVGQGSTFWIELPLASSPLEQAALDEAAQDSARGAGREEQAGTILYIEDNLSNISLIEHALSAQDYHVKLLTAMQGSVGLELAAQHTPDLILLDVHLPDIMGDAVLRHLKASALTQSIPVVVLSADATPSQVERLLSGGAQSYLTKPLDLKQFFEVLEQVLSRTA